MVFEEHDGGVALVVEEGPLEDAVVERKLFVGRHEGIDIIILLYNIINILLYVLLYNIYNIYYCFGRLGAGTLQSFPLTALASMHCSYSSD
jgi:hypothetical protein